MLHSLTGGYVGAVFGAVAAGYGNLQHAWTLVFVGIVVMMLVIAGLDSCFNYKR